MLTAVVITGASSGIGAALATALAKDGYAVFACARRQERLNALASIDRSIFTQVCNVSEIGDVERFVSAVSARTKVLYALVNCAGSYGEIGALDELDPERWLQTLRVNVYGTLLASRSFLPLLAAEKGARIINFAGGGAFNPLPRYSAYAVSKAGVVRLTETMAKELEPMGIFVNAVAPGFVDTEIHHATLAVGPIKAGNRMYETTLEKLKNGAVPINVPVDCVRFLLSSRANGLTGKTISASFDPWTSEAFLKHITEINQSDLYTMQRINLEHLPNDPLSRVLKRN